MLGVSVIKFFLANGKGRPYFKLSSSNLSIIILISSIYKIEPLLLRIENKIKKICLN